MNWGRDQQWTRVMTTSRISDQRSPDSTKIGGWLFRHRTSIPLPFALVLVLVRVGEAPFAWTLVAGGAILTLTGELIRLWGVHHIGAISRTRSERLGPLVDTGPFALVRNPLYIGNILLWVGFALTARLVWFAPVIVVLLGVEYHAIVKWEEQLLATRLGDAYSAYCAHVPRWLPRIKGPGPYDDPTKGPGPYSAATQGWRPTLFSERGTLIAIALGYLLLWLKARF
jgi:protein-S-isoprenylcysteine O-methyltransferase Ste14